MRKAASHKVGYLTLVIFVAIVVLFASATRVAAYTSDPNEVPIGDQDINDGIIGFITINGTQANATVENIGDSTESGGFASYLKGDGNTDTQTLFSSIIFTLEPHSKKDLIVELPCYGQVDLFKGDVLNNFNNGARYGSRLVAAMHTKNECASPSILPSATPTVTPVATPSETPGQGGGIPTPTATPVITNSPAPSASVTPGPTSTPVATSIPTPDGGGNSTPSGGQILGSTTPQGGLTLPSTGSSDYGFLAFAGYVLAGGIWMRKYAKSLV
ncbi:MAG: hypothetical protein M3Q44_05320 [bacterium]|nr:hypothetical protein [bacterium]